MLLSSALSRTKWVAKGLVHERMCSNVRFPFDVILLSLADPLVEVRRVIPASPLRGELVAAKLTRIITLHAIFFAGALLPVHCLLCDG
jgi:hypothetical protein